MIKSNINDRFSGYFKKNLETMPYVKRIEYLNQKLRGIVRYAYKHSTAFREKMDSSGLKPKDIRTIKDLAKIPMTKKADLIELQKKNPPFGGFEGVPISELRRIYVSPGPIHEPGERDYQELGWVQGMYAAGFRPGDIVLNTFSYHMVPFALEMLDNSLFKLGCLVVPGGVGNTEQQINVLKTLRVTGFCGTSSFLLTIAEKAEEMGLNLKKDLFLKVGFVAAEMLPESLRSKLEEKFGMIVRQGYGTADIRCLGYECIKKNGMHIPDDKIVEIVDPNTGEQLGPGKVGEIVGTTFNKTYPLIRFATGDLSFISESPCPCGRTSPRIMGILGRADQATKVRGLFIHPNQIDEIASKHPEIINYQMVISRKDHKDEMIFKVELKEGIKDLEMIKREIEKTIRDVTTLRGEVQFVKKGEISEPEVKIKDLRKWQ